ncbi:MAG: FtsQ-type POTRA domain-containing protein [Eubacterium sp.]|nr:FtsQ-type POTRA domain-containing protein [Eubacterium sp.]
MKKKTNQKPNNRQNRSEDIKNIDSHLGSFGLEPPKIYNRDTTLPQRQEERRQRKTNANLDKSTPQAKRKTQNKKRRLKKKFRNALYALLVFVGIISVILVLSLTVLFKVEAINVTGNQRYTTQEIMAVLPLEKDKNLFVSDTKKAKEKLEKSLPYIYNADIKRKFPSTINVTITETDKVYTIKNKDNTYTILDDNFKVLEDRSPKAPKNRVRIKKAAVKSAVVGETVELTNKKQLQRLIKLTEELKAIEFDNVTAIYSQDINNNFIVYDNRIVIKLGSLDKMQDKLYAVLSALDKLSQTNPSAEGEMTATSDKQIYFTEK